MVDPGAPGYALFHNGTQVSKTHSTMLAAMQEAYERGCVNCWHPLRNAATFRTFVEGYEVKEIRDG